MMKPCLFACLFIYGRATLRFMQQPPPGSKIFPKPGHLAHGGEACWAECGKKSGPCEYCGIGACCRLGRDGEHEICDKHLDGNKRMHVCVAPQLELMNEGTNCWKQCDEHEGFCSFCGDGACCRQDSEQWTAHREECLGDVGGKHMHTCVVPAAQVPDQVMDEDPVSWEKMEATSCGAEDGCEAFDAFIVNCHDQECDAEGVRNGVGDARAVKNVDREDARKFCGHLCEKHPDCTGFRWEEHHCYFLQRPLCGFLDADSFETTKGTKGGMDCYIKEDNVPPTTAQPSTTEPSTTEH